MIEIRHAPAPARSWSRFTPVVLVAMLALAVGSLAGVRVRRNARAQAAERHRAPRWRSRLPARHSMLIAAIAVVAFSAYWMGYPRDLGARPAFNSPRASVGYTLTERFIDGHGFSMPLRHSEIVPTDIALALTPRDAANVDGNVVPKDFAGTMLLHAAAMAVHPSLALFVGPFFAIISAALLMKLGADLFDRATGLLAFILWLAFAPLWVNAADVFTGDLPALAFLLAAMLAFMRYWRAPSVQLAAWTGACFAASVLFRYPNILLAVPPVAALIVTRRLVPAHIAACAVAGAPFALVLFAFNYTVYGAPLTTGFHLGAELMAATVNYSQESFFKRRPEVLLHYLATYGREPLIAAPVALGIAAAVAAAWRRNGDVRAFALITLATFTILLAYYGQQDAWGYTAAQLNASFLRYLLPGFALLTVFAAWALASAAKRSGPLVYAGVTIFAVASAWYVYAGPSGVHETRGAIDRTQELRQEIIAATEPDSVVAVRIMDKVIFPERQTLTLTYAIHNESPIAKDRLETWERVPSPERFAEVALAINALGIPFYVLPDARFGDLAPYQDALKERGYYLRRIRSVQTAAFYKVSRQEPR